MARRTHILDALEPDEKILADRGYQGLDERCITPIKKPASRPLTSDERTFNKAVASVRVDVERAIGVIKRFHCLQQDWRHDRSYHPVCFHFCANLANVIIRHEPLRSFLNPWLQ